MTPSPLPSDRQLNATEFREIARALRADLAEHTGLGVAELARNVGESLAVLRLVGSLIRPALAEAASRDAPDELQSLLSGSVTGIVNLATSEGLPLSIAWGNVASLVASSARLVSESDPGLRDPAHRVALAVLSTAPLAGSWTGELGVDFRRTSCCQISGRGDRGCGDCGRH